MPAAYRALSARTPSTAAARIAASSVPRLGRRVGEVAEDGEVEVRLAVGEVLHLEVLERLVHRLHAAEQRRDHDRGAELGRDAVLAEVELGQRCAAAGTR